MATYLEEKFRDLWDISGAEGDFSAVFLDLVDKYSKPHRNYHNLSHIENSFREFDRIKKEVNDPISMGFAIWFHDYVYDPRSNDNEVKSLEIFKEFSRSTKIKKSIVENTSNLILTTIPGSIPLILDQKIMHDIDISIFGQNEEIFDEYERGIRVEYGWVSENDFRIGRLNVLNSFLRSKTIYLTRYFIEKYEEQARKNLSRSIELLSNS